MTAAVRKLPESEISPTLPPGVVEACTGERQALLPFIMQAMRLASQTFAPVKDVSAEVDIDPETDERRIVVNVTTDLPVDEMLNRYRAYTRQWIDVAPATVREWVRLSYHIPEGR